MPLNRKSWPKNLNGNIKSLIHECELLTDNIDTCLKALERIKYAAISDLIPALSNSCDRISKLIYTIDAKKTEREGPGQPERWRRIVEYLALETLEEVLDFKLTITRAHQRNNYQLLKECLLGTKEFINDTLELVNLIPFDETDQGQGIAVSNWPVSVENEE